ncbi:hypothetical protein [uncultured Brachyspira sp.]|uniref:hypothetical protein n=1 Tax=uncultured Brachyspira sp. TaxID=221953 RepID=UPI0025DC196D|nr:hypothetical protein [uncultured Brachyspira sp.]
MKKLQKKLPKPSVENAEYYLEKWDKNEMYVYKEKALNKLFFELYPYNKDIESILTKTSVLNDFYGTNIFNVFTVAEHIYKNVNNIDERLNSRDITLVDDIKKVTIKNHNTLKTINFYSFATKYCSHHKPAYYPIYDKYVDYVLRYFRNEDNFFSFKNDDLKEYNKFENIICEFIKFYKLDNYCFKQIDMYLWQLGMDHFK